MQRNIPWTFELREGSIAWLNDRAQKWCDDIIEVVKNEDLTCAIIIYCKPNYDIERVLEFTEHLTYEVHWEIRVRYLNELIHPIMV